MTNSLQLRRSFLWLFLTYGTMKWGSTHILGIMPDNPRLSSSIISFMAQSLFREWSLITGRGGLQNGRGGHGKFYPYEKGGRKKF